jgi:hypothetical protein
MVRSPQSRTHGEGGCQAVAGRACASLVWGMAFFGVVQLASLVLLERCWPQLRDPEYGRKWVLLQYRLAAAPDRPLLLVLGSSRIELGFHPDALPPLRLADGRTPLVFNYGLTGAGPLQELLCLRRLLAAGIRPRWVLLEVLPHALHNDGLTLDQLRMERLTWGDLRVLRRYAPRAWPLYCDWCMAQLPPWFSQRFHVMNRYARDWLPWSSRQDELWEQLAADGWWTYPAAAEKAGPVERHRRSAAVRAQLGGLDGFQVSAFPDRCLREVLEICRREGIGVALVMMPEASEFRAWYPPGADGAIRTYAERLRADYQVPVIDGREWLPDADFFDPHHLLARGADAFTRRFGREALEPWICGERTRMP